MYALSQQSLRYEEEDEKSNRPPPPSPSIQGISETDNDTKTRPSNAIFSRHPDCEQKEVVTRPKVSASATKRAGGRKVEGDVAARASKGPTQTTAVANQENLVDSNVNHSGKANRSTRGARTARNTPTKESIDALARSTIASPNTDITEARDARPEELRPGAFAVGGTGNGLSRVSVDEEFGRQDPQTLPSSTPRLTARIVEKNEEQLEQEVLELRAAQDKLQHAPVAQIVPDNERDQKCSPRNKRLTCASVMLLLLAIVAVVVGLVLTRNNAPNESKTDPQVSLQMCQNDTVALFQGNAALSQAFEDSANELNATFNNCSFSLTNSICIIDGDTFSSTPALDAACAAADGVLYKYTALATCTVLAFSDFSLSFTYKNMHQCFAPSCDANSIRNYVEVNIDEELALMEQEFSEENDFEIDCDFAIDSLTDAAKYLRS
jgi:hypothetical protein